MNFLKSLSLSFLTCTLLMLLFMSCGSNQEDTPTAKEVFKDCKYGQPIPIFSADLPQIGGHSFTIKQKEGVELVSFKNGMDLELVQSGCNKITQDFQFMLGGTYQGDDKFWVNEAVKQFQYLGSIGEQFAVLSFWGQAIQAKMNDFRLGQAIEVQPGFYAKINKVLSPNRVIITVKLSEN